MCSRAPSLPSGNHPYPIGMGMGFLSSQREMPLPFSVDCLLHERIIQCVSLPNWLVSLSTVSQGPSVFPVFFTPKWM